MTHKCYYCEGGATVFCDFVIGATYSGAGKPKTVVTCDRPICNFHRRKVGHICDRSRRTTNNNSDTIDHCKAHGETDAD